MRSPSSRWPSTSTRWAAASDPRTRGGGVRTSPPRDHGGRTARRDHEGDANRLPRSFAGRHPLLRPTGSRRPRTASLMGTGSRVGRVSEGRDASSGHPASTSPPLSGRHRRAVARSGEPDDPCVIPPRAGRSNRLDRHVHASVACRDGDRALEPPRERPAADGDGRRPATRRMPPPRRTSGRPGDGTGEGPEWSPTGV